MILKLKRNEYNEKHPTSSLSVLHFSVCRDLMGRFAEVNAEIVRPFLWLLIYILCHFLTKFFLESLLIISCLHNREMKTLVLLKLIRYAYYSFDI